VHVGGALGRTEVVGSGVGDATVVLGGHQLTVPLVVRETIVGPQGMIGMDVLRGTILTVRDDVTAKVFWQLASSA
jgi:hypothetical protein